MRFVAVLLVANAMFFVGPAAEAKQGENAKRRPNVLVILADDLGYGDLQC